MPNDKEHFEKTLTPKFSTFAENINGLEIEFNHNKCLFRLPKAVDKNETMNFCDIGLELYKIFNSK